MARSVAACLAVLLAVFEVGSCIKCYQCNTQSDKTCGEPFTALKSSVNCADTAAVSYNQQYLYNILPPESFGGVENSQKYCHKIVMESGTVVRTCIDGVLTDMTHTCNLMLRSTKTSTPDKKIKSCVMCDKDNCNGAGSLSFSLPLAVVALTASYLLYKQ